MDEATKTKILIEIYRNAARLYQDAAGSPDRWIQADQLMTIALKIEGME